jgi:hypothetical protein
LNGFSNYSTIDYRCESCHGTLPTSGTHAVTGTSTPQGAFKNIANKWGALAPTYTGTTCGTTYCHNPAAYGVMPLNPGTNTAPSWTDATYLADGGKSLANCQKCHLVPGSAGFTKQAAHTGAAATTDATANQCNGCHGHNGDKTGVLGQRHIDGILSAAGNCDSCHGYQVGSWASKAERSGVAEGKGAHEQHIAYLTARYGVTLTPAGDAFGSGTSWTSVCGVCHNGATHSTGEAIPGTGRNISIQPAYWFGTGTGTPTYNGVVGQSSSAYPKNCSNVSCHFMTTPVWSTY